MGYEDFQRERSDRSGGSRFGDRRGGGRSFGGDRRSGGGRGFSGSRGGFGGGRDRRELPQCDAVCAKCGKNCKVPFKPTGDKPVYCSDCFSSSPSRSSESSKNSSGITTAQFDQLNKKLDKILEILHDAEISDEEESEVSEAE